jgi:hypothetical protein
MGPGASGGQKRRGGRLAFEVGGLNGEPEMNTEFWEASIHGVDEASRCCASDRVGLGLPVIVIPAPPGDLLRLPRTTFGRR